jgi:hypothetical protein
LEEDIIAIQEKLGIDSNSIRAKTQADADAEADAQAVICVYLTRGQKFHGPLEDVPSLLIHKYVDMRIKNLFY